MVNFSFLPNDNSSETILNHSLCVNITDCLEILNHAPQFLPETLVRVIVLVTIAVLAIIGNIATLLSIRMKVSKNHSTVYWLIAHLAVADIMVSLFCLIADAVWMYTVQWLAGNIACKVIKFLQMFTLYLSTFILVVIGVDRYSAVRFPIQKVNSQQRCKRSIVIVWILSAIFSLPQAIIFRVVKGPFVEEFYQCVTYGFYTEAWQEQLYTTASLVLMFLLPLCILMFTYICTFYTIAKKENSFSDHPNEAMNEVRRNLLRKAKTKALMITVVIMVAFVICWAPYYSTMIIFIFLKPNSQLSQDLQSAVFFFGSSTAMINPLIYGAFHLRRGAPRRRPTHSSGSSRAENTVMQVVVRRKRVGSGKIQYVLPVIPQNGDTTLEKRLSRQLANSMCSLHSNHGERERQQEHSL